MAETFLKVAACVSALALIWFFVKGSNNGRR